ncbi:hypothetical protein EHQ81_11975 [Leptospira selangorensis]|uniref:Uncharacterized protein n=1 Tax=Leptospira selangorensis TaxID=2484982 RepID=A0A5F2C2Y5_9LEPT|nr:hypothetical protein [Leptospira selangorensis]TGM13543.1 hypothetical protein EHQ81_11975 [Leptospira selangorensis]TGM22117.1 hypothetical protein EHQ82_06750 [Leptospira selangorensis]
MKYIQKLILKIKSMSKFKMKSKKQIFELFGDSIATRNFIDSFLDTNDASPFDQFLDYSYNSNVLISTDFGGEDPSSEYFIYTATFSTYKPSYDWMHAVKVKFKELGYKNPPQYKDIPQSSQSGKYIDFIKFSEKYFKGFVVSLAIPKSIESIFSNSLENTYKEIKFKSKIPNFNLSPKNTEKALRISTLISITLYTLRFHTRKGGYFWISDKDSIAKITENENLFENTVMLQMNILQTLLDGKLPMPIGYSLPWKGEEEDLSYILIALNDLFSGALADFATNTPYGSKSPTKTVKDKSSSILYHSKGIPKFFYRIIKDGDTYYGSRIKIDVEL